ncbi:hypothetical protein NQ117_19765 [Paenibacillus sp. SC116]|nr:hypothetical protein [Paenibacillus sp. SC116]
MLIQLYRTAIGPANSKRHSGNYFITYSKGVKIAGDTGATFQSILSSIERIHHQTLEVSATSEELSASTEQVTASMQEIVTIARDSLERLNVISLSADEQKKSVGQLSVSADHLNQLSSELEVLVDKYQIQ